jgi:regulator of replication initiation timing
MDKAAAAMSVEDVANDVWDVAREVDELRTQLTETHALSQKLQTANERLEKKVLEQERHQRDMRVSADGLSSDVYVLECELLTLRTQLTETNAPSQKLQTANECVKKKVLAQERQLRDVTDTTEAAAAKNKQQFRHVQITMDRWFVDTAEAKGIYSDGAYINDHGWCCPGGPSEFPQTQRRLRDDERDAQVQALLAQPDGMERLLATCT